MSDLEHVHQLLDTVEQTIASLDRLNPNASVDVTEVSDFCLAVNDILEYDRTAYNSITTALGINPSILNKFLKFNGKVRVHTARHLADRLRNYLRSLDQVTDRPPAATTGVHNQPLRGTQLSTEATPQPFSFPAEQWRLVQLSSEMKIKIAAITSLLDTIIIQMQRTNNPPEHQILSGLERHSSSLSLKLPWRSSRLQSWKSLCLPVRAMV